MTDSAANVDADEARDELLAELIGKLHAQRQAGEEPDVEKLAAEHPDLAHELRQLWTTAQLADDLAQLSISSLNSLSPMAATLIHTPTGEGDVRPPMPGQLPRDFGDYELLEELGRGGMGIVYRAKQKSLDREVAVKMILRGALASGVDVARFRAEAESAARLEHPHIVSIYEVGEADEQPYFSMQYVPGQTLARKLDRGPLPAREAAALLLPVVRAVAEAHRRGVLHRDLKPSNILIDKQGSPHVTDFGLAKRIESDQSLTHSGAILGTPSYMAPEQAAGRRGNISPASDVYSLGTILYEMLTGRAPFQAQSPVDTMLLVLEQDPLPPRLLNPKADPELELIALKCLQKPPDLRYNSADDLADDLQRYLDGEPISARSGAFTQVIGRILRETHHAGVLENWGLLWMWHSLVLLVLCLVTNWIYLSDHREQRWIYVAIWSGGLTAWAAIFWQLRHRAGPITFVERQVAHVWGASIIGSTLLFAIEALLGLPALTLSPVLAVLSGSVFLVKASILTGRFYFQAAALYATVLPMALWPDYGVSIFGVVSAGCFFFPGLKYYRQRVTRGK